MKNRTIVDAPISLALVVGLAIAGGLGAATLATKRMLSPTRESAVPGEQAQGPVFSDLSAVTRSSDDSTWTTIAHPTSADRIVHSVVYDPVGDKVYMLGGSPAALPGTYLNLCQQYDPTANTWANKANMPTARGWATATYARGKVYVIGGIDNSSTVLANNEAYDISANTWATKAPRPNALVAPLAAAWRDSLIYVMGGTDTFLNPYASVDVYNLAANAWSVATDLPQPAAMGGCAIVGDTIYIANALDFTGGGSAWTNLRKGAIDPIDPSTITWVDGGATPVPVTIGATAALNGAVYWLGGFESLNTVTNRMFRYDIATGVISEFWPAYPITIARCNFMTARVSNGEMYVMAGDANGDWWPPNNYYYKIEVPGWVPPDVGVSTIISSAGTIDSTQVLVPVCSVYNYGSTTASYRVRMKVGSFYNHVAAVYGHEPGTFRYVTFDSCGGWQRGTQAVSCSTEFAGDTSTGNDRDTGSVRVRVIDAGTAELLVPPDSVDLGATIAPEAIVSNFGTDTASFRFYVRIGGEYADSLNLTDLSPGHSQDVTLSPWTPLRLGSFACRCSAALSGDLNPGNNALTRRVCVRGRDVSPEILAPTGIVDSGAVVTPRAKVRNFGSFPAVFPVWFRIETASAAAERECTMLSKNEHPRRSTGIQGSNPSIGALTTVYLDSVWLSVPPHDSTVVDFSTWIAAPPDTYRLLAFTDLARDTVRANDTDKAQIVVGPAHHDVGVTRILSPMHRVRLGDTVRPQAEVRNYGLNREVFAVRFQIGSSYSQDIIDTAPPAASDTVQFGVWVAEPEGIYAVTCSTELAGDMTPGNDRIQDSVQVFIVGVGESGENWALPQRLRLDGVMPNPSFGRATFAYSTQRDCAVTLRIFTAAGMLVRRLETPVQKAGPHRLDWDGFDDWGRAVGRGIYFCRLDAGEMGAETKLVRMR